MFRGALVALLALSLTGGMVACSDDDNGGNVCKQAFQKQKTCFAVLDCSTLEAEEQMACETAKPFFDSLSYDQSMAICEQGFPNEPERCECTGEAKTEAEELMRCTLNDACACEATEEPDGGTHDAAVEDDAA